MQLKYNFTPSPESCKVASLFYSTTNAQCFSCSPQGWTAAIFFWGLLLTFTSVPTLKVYLNPHIFLNPEVRRGGFLTAIRSLCQFCSIKEISLHFLPCRLNIKWKNIFPMSEKSPSYTVDMRCWHEVSTLEDFPSILVNFGFILIFMTNGICNIGQIERLNLKNRDWDRNWKPYSGFNSCLFYPKLKKVLTLFIF